MEILALLHRSIRARALHGAQHDNVWKYIRCHHSYARIMGIGLQTGFQPIAMGSVVHFGQFSDADSDQVMCSWPCTIASEFQQAMDQHLLSKGALK